MGTGNTKSYTSADLRIGALIRARRQQLQLTLQELCDEANISVGYLSQVERDLATPSLGTLAQIAHGLGVGVDYFIAVPCMEDSLTRAAERSRFSVNSSSILYEQIAVDFAGNTLSAVIMHVPPGYQSETVTHEGEEIIYVLDGSICQWIDREKTTLGPGDSMHYRSNRPHAWANQTEQTARMLCVGTMPVFRNHKRDSVPGR